MLSTTGLPKSLDAGVPQPQPRAASLSVSSVSIIWSISGIRIGLLRGVGLWTPRPRLLGRPVVLSIFCCSRSSHSKRIHYRPATDKSQGITQRNGRQDDRGRFRKDNTLKKLTLLSHLFSFSLREGYEDQAKAVAAFALKQGLQWWRIWELWKTLPYGRFVVTLPLRLGLHRLVGAASVTKRPNLGLFPLHDVA